MPIDLTGKIRLVLKGFESSYLEKQNESDIMFILLLIKTWYVYLNYSYVDITGLWFSLGIPVSVTNKSDSHDITEILLKVALNTIKQKHKLYTMAQRRHTHNTLANTK